MAWSVVKIDSGKKCLGIPSASVGFGRLSLNVAACELIQNYESYQYAELLQDPSRPSTVGVRLLEESTEDSIKIKRKIMKGKVTGGIDIPSKNHMEKLFGITGTQNKTTHFSVKKEKDEKNILVIYTK